MVRWGGMRVGTELACAHRGLGRCLWLADVYEQGCLCAGEGLYYTIIQATVLGRPGKGTRQGQGQGQGFMLPRFVGSEPLCPWAVLESLFT